MASCGIAPGRCLWGARASPRQAIFGGAVSRGKYPARGPLAAAAAHVLVAAWLRHDLQGNAAWGVSGLAAGGYEYTYLRVAPWASSALLVAVLQKHHGVLEPWDERRGVLNVSGLQLARHEIKLLPEDLGRQLLVPPRSAHLGLGLGLGLGLLVPPRSAHLFGKPPCPADRLAPGSGEG